MKRTALICGSCIAGALIVGAHGSAPAATLFHINTFDDNTTASWTSGAGHTIQPSGGPSGEGDAYLQLVSHGIKGISGSVPSTHNQAPEWTGDFLDVGAQRVAVDLQNSSTSPLEMRFVLFGPLVTTERWTSTDAMVVPNDSTWHRYQFFLAESQLTQVGGVDNHGNLIQDVLQVQLRHDPGDASAGGTPIPATLGIDNIQLLPGGDFDNNGDWNCDDVDALTAVIADASHLTLFDLTGEGMVDELDLTEWLRLAGHVNVGAGRVYLPADANLDATVDGLDFVVWNEHKFSETSAWCSADFNANGVVDGVDFLTWNENKFTSSDGLSVPEPTWLASTWPVWLFLLARAFAEGSARIRVADDARPVGVSVR